MSAPRLLTLLRHGSTTAPPGLLVGRYDPGLDERGWKQSEAGLSEATRALAPTRLASSPRARCRAFAEDQARARGLPLLVDDGLAEIDFGEREASLPQGRGSAPPRWLEDLWAGRSAPPGGESFHAFKRRVTKALRRWLADGTPRRGHTPHDVLFTHGGVIAVALALLLEMPIPAARRIAVAHGGFVQLSLLEGHPAYLVELFQPGQGATP